MEQLKAESSEKKRTGILLQFKKTQVERDKSFKVVPIDSLPEEEQDEARKLLKLREEIADRWAETVRMEDGKYVDHPDLDSAMHEFQKIDDEFRRRGWTVAVPGAGTSFFNNLNQAIHDLSESYKGMSTRWTIADRLWIAPSWLCFTGYFRGYSLFSVVCARACCWMT